MFERVEHPLVFSEGYTIRAHEVSVGHTLTSPALLMLLQEASMGSAAELRMSVHDASMDNLGWVLLRKRVNIHKVPSLSDSVVVDTFPSHFDRAFAHRDYYMYGGTGELLVSASSVWTLLDLQTRKMVRIPQSLRDLDLPSQQLPLPDRKIDRVSTCHIEHEYVVRYHDMDWNYHLNNINLLKIILQCVPDGYIERFKCMPSEVMYTIKSESYLNDVLIVSTEATDKGEMLHEVRRKIDDTLIAQAQTIWT